MTAEEFHLFAIVEGYGEVDAVPKLLHRIWNDARVAVSLRTDESPHRIPKGLFIDNAAKRCEVLETAAEWAREMRGGVLILMDADADCCKKLLNEKQMKKVRGDIACILADTPHCFALAEKGYESWLVAGFGGDQSNPKNWLKNQFGKYSKIPDQKKLTSIPEFDIKRAYEINVSFRRFRDRVLALPGKAV